MVIFFSFFTWGSTSLLPYLFAFLIGVKPNDVSELFGYDILYLSSCILTGIGLFLLGALKSIFTAEKWYLAGTFVFLNGLLAGLAGYFIGHVLGNWVALE